MPEDRTFHSPRDEKEHKLQSILETFCNIAAMNKDHPLIDADVP